MEFRISLKNEENLYIESKEEIVDLVYECTMEKDKFINIAGNVLIKVDEIILIEKIKED